MQLRKRRILEKTVSGEKGHVPDLTPDAVMIPFLREIFPQPLFAHVGFYRQWISPLSRDGQSVGIQIGRKNLQFRPDLPSGSLVGDQHGERVSLLAAGAAWRPNANGTNRVFVLAEQIWDHLPGKGIESIPVAKERRHRYEEIREQAFHFFGFGFEALEVLLKPFHLADLHPPREPPVDGRALIAREIVAGARAQVAEDALQHLLVAWRQMSGWNVFFCFDDFHELTRKLANGKHHVGQPRCNSAPRHRWVFGLIRILHQDEAARLLDGLRAKRSVRASARQHHREPVAMLIRERPEELIDGRASSSRFVEREGRNLMVRNEKPPVRRNDKNLVRLKRSLLVHLLHRHLRFSCKYFCKLAVVGRLKVNDHHIGSACAWRYFLKKKLKRLQSAGGCANADGWETRLELRLGRFFYRKGFAPCHIGHRCRFYHPLIGRTHLQSMRSLFAENIIYV